MLSTKTRSPHTPSPMHLQDGVVLIHLSYTTVYVTYPLGGLSKFACSTTKEAPIPNDTSSESSRRDVSNADLLRHRHYSSCGDSEHRPSAQGCVMYTVEYGSFMRITPSPEGHTIHICNCCCVADILVKKFDRHRIPS